MSKIPVVAIIGRPNVGKSTLFNRIIGQRRSIVHNYPGVTRDRVIEMAEYRNVAFTLIDTGGFDIESEDIIVQHINRQVELAAETSDIALFITDGVAGITGADQECADLLRRLGKPVILGVNKMEKEANVARASEFYSLGFEDTFFISAEHGRDVAELLDRMLEFFPEQREPEEEERPYCSLAIVGRPNVGKSSLVNALVGEERVIVTEVAGTTRDTVDTDFTYYKKRYRVIDTAGIRRRKKVKWALEKISVLMAMKSAERADVCLLVLDANEEIAEQDAKIAGLAHESGRGVVVIVNKWDLVTKDHSTMKRFEEGIRDKFKFLAYAPIEYVSCKSGQRLHKVLETATRVREQQDIRIGTHELNELLSDASEGIPPPRRGTKKLKMFYATQVSSRPPTIVIFCNDPSRVHFSYERYLINQIRARYRFEGLPLRLIWRAKGRRK